MNDKKKKLRIEKYKYNNFRNTEFIPKRCTDCNTKKQGKISFRSRDDNRIKNLKKNTPNLEIYSCPSGNGWHVTSDIHFEKRLEIRDKFKDVEIALYIDDKRYLFHINKKNYAFSQFLYNKKITNLKFLTLWDENEKHTRNLQYLKILKKFLLQYNYEPYEIEIYINKENGTTLYGYAFASDYFRKIEELLSQNNIEYYFYMTDSGILKISYNFT